MPTAVTMIAVMRVFSVERLIDEAFREALKPENWPAVKAEILKRREEACAMKAVSDTWKADTAKAGADYYNVRANQILLALHFKTTPKNVHFCQVHNWCPPEMMKRSALIEAWSLGGRTVIERQPDDKEATP